MLIWAKGLVLNLRANRRCKQACELSSVSRSLSAAQSARGMIILGQQAVPSLYCRRQVTEEEKSIFFKKPFMLGVMLGVPLMTDSGFQANNFVCLWNKYQPIQES